MTSTLNTFDPVVRDVSRSPALISPCVRITGRAGVTERELKSVSPGSEGEALDLLSKAAGIQREEVGWRANDVV
jgi:hypothetical protein